MRFEISSLSLPKLGPNLGVLQLPVNAVVHHDEPARGWSVLSEGEPGVQQNGDVVVPVQEDEWLLAQNYKHRVAKLWQLRQNEHPRPEPWDFILLYETEKIRKRIINECIILIFSLEDGTTTYLSDNWLEQLRVRDPGLL